MARKQAKTSRRMLFTWFMLTGLILLFAPQELTGKFQLAFVHIFRWPLSMGGSVALTARTQQLAGGASQPGERQYRNYIANLQQTLDEQRRKFEKLYGLDNTFVWEGADFALADVITATTDGSRNELTIACRKTDGLTKGQYVLGDESVIGIVSEVFPQIAKADVKLVTDSTSWIPVEVAGLKNILKGNGDYTARIEWLKNAVKVGEDVFALKKAGLLDAPIIVGTVSRCERNTQNASLWDVTVEPACDIQKLEDVAVIIIRPPK
ncbi:MAG: rod shape-determining protein MreC [Phycisphaerales bacterium]|nr:MAG: rod shape-determining protein MreC [Phycisphaerales bacterium]